MGYTQLGLDPGGDALSAGPGIGERFDALASRIIDRTRHVGIGPDAFELMAITGIGISPRILAHAVAARPPCGASGAATHGRR